MNSCLLLWMRYLFDMGSTIKEKNLLLEEQILSFKSLRQKIECFLLTLFIRDILAVANVIHSLLYITPPFIKCNTPEVCNRINLVSEYVSFSAPDKKG